MFLLTYHQSGCPQIYRTIFPTDSETSEDIKQWKTGLGLIIKHALSFVYPEQMAYLSALLEDLESHEIK